ncbi:MAG: hypothetical protein Q4E47_02565 [Candidatus Saccharibacteria bacterium]|nr:hypothetical protein [Candidatus Saccharibacteria bacterium]
MNYGENGGGNAERANFEALRNLERGPESPVETEKTDLEKLRAAALGKMVGETIRTGEALEKNDLPEAQVSKANNQELDDERMDANQVEVNAGTSPEMFSQEIDNKQNELGQITTEEPIRDLVDDDVKNTETGSIQDKDGVDEATFKDVERVMKIDNLGKRGAQAALLAKKFKVGRYADRSYMRGSESKTDSLLKELRHENTGERVA